MKSAINKQKLAAAIDDLFCLCNACGSYWGIPHLFLHKKINTKESNISFVYIKV